ncbi:MAG: DNA polymerase III subunit delta [Fidelibacterota bacterium]
MAFILDELKKIEKGELAPAYLLYGDDLYLEEEAIDTLTRTFTRLAKNRPTEKKIYYAADNLDDTFMQNLINIGLFSVRQIVIYKDLPKLTKGYRKPLLQYLDHPQADTLLILTAGGGQSAPVFSSVKKHPVVKQLSTWSPDTNKYPEIIQHALENRGFTITNEALDALALATDDSLSHAFAEIEKICIYVEPNREIDVDAVCTVISGTKDYQIKDFLNAIEQRNLYEALHICLALIETGIKSTYIIFTLYNFFVNVWAFQQIHRDSHPSYFPAQKRRLQYEHAYQNYRDCDFGALFAHLQAADLQAKSVTIKPENLLVPLIYQLLKC